MKSANTHVFLIHTAFQELVCEKIISKLNLENEKDRYVAIYEGVPPRSCRVWDDFLEVESCGGSVLNLRDKSIKKIYSFIKGQPFLKRFYFSDLAWPTNNIMYNQLRHDGERKYSLFMDGVFVYFDPEVLLSQYLKSLVKAVASKLLSGYCYRPYFGKLMGWQQKFVDEVWGAELEKSDIDKSKIRSIEFYKLDSTPANERKGTLFLDQPYHRKYFLESGKTLSEIVLRSIKDSFEAPYYYKMHHFQDQDVSEDFLSQGFTIVKSSESVENLEVINKVKNVVSVNSTALITSKLMYREDVRCYHLMEMVGHQLTPEKAHSKINEVFNEFNVEPI